MRDIYMQQEGVLCSQSGSQRASERVGRSVGCLGCRQSLSLPVVGLQLYIRLPQMNEKIFLCPYLAFYVFGDSIDSGTK